MRDTKDNNFLRLLDALPLHFLFPFGREGKTIIFVALLATIGLLSFLLLMSAILTSN